MPSIRDSPGVIAPPPILLLGMLAIGLAVDFLLMRLSTHIPAYPRQGLAILLLAGACFLATAAIRGFWRAGTHVEPWEPSTALVTAGVYRFSRNPMYLAGAMLYAAVALAIDSGVTLLLLAPLVAILRYGVIAREERYLQAKFGDEYRRYRATVRRWI